MPLASGKHEFKLIYAHIHSVYTQRLFQLFTHEYPHLTHKYDSVSDLLWHKVLSQWKVLRNVDQVFIHCWNVRDESNSKSTHRAVTFSQVHLVVDLKRRISDCVSLSWKVSLTFVPLPLQVWCVSYIRADSGGWRCHYCEWTIYKLAETVVCVIYSTFFCNQYSKTFPPFSTHYSMNRIRKMGNDWSQRLGGQ